jgi:hypothetical protein
MDPEVQNPLETTIMKAHESVGQQKQLFDFTI